ncbi:DUF1289 domain-containing protein [Methylorubrum sp. SL192]|uniref:DUF1289 domain-containing protein n=1 Tax=Methylorubrum sp. SL192 TaxID=2995167 RepID=UPI002273C6B7|nr:DUF1289 domain-containing protein [Methylorubrum sp. SL192]MCY1645404.1 DUF1289 domain-containing protein [Methylorubrum sp. SL192]
MLATPSKKPSSPCTKLCVLDAVTGLCEGCGRTRDEIGLWGSLSEAQRLAVMAALPERLRRAYPGREVCAP